MFVGALSLQASKACPKTLACVFACRWTSLPDQRTRQRPSRRRQRCACGCCGTRRLCCGGLVCARPRYGRHWGPSRHLPLVNAQQCDAVCTAHTAQQCGMHCPSAMRHSNAVCTAHRTLRSSPPISTYQAAKAVTVSSFNLKLLSGDSVLRKAFYKADWSLRSLHFNLHCDAPVNDP